MKDYWNKIHKTCLYDEGDWWKSDEDRDYD